ncbi:MAG: biotin--[Prevotella sp.]|nr:biotin--[acetyl-CoA-carboxylase] ligase [Prevotella sp.]
MEIIHLTNITSTNDYLLSLKSQEDIVAVSDYQTRGKGMGTNRWESEPGKNLLFSILIHPTWIPVNQQYLLSMAEAVALCDTLREVTDDITIKWPNDIYWKDKKISGTRIDVNLSGGILADMVIGTGINVNQTEFLSDAPNPVSLKQITGREHDREALLNDILERFQPLQQMLKDGGTEEIVRLYHERLYRKEGMHGYKDANGTFMAAIDYVEPSGILHLTLEDGTKREYMFKEVATN